MPKCDIIYKIIEAFSVFILKTLIILTLDQTTKLSLLPKEKVYEGKKLRKHKGLFKCFLTCCKM